MEQQSQTSKPQPEIPRFYPVKIEGFDGQKYLEEHSMELNYDFDQVNGIPVLIVSKKQ